MKLMYTRTYLIAAALALGAGCAVFGLTKPKEFPEQVAYVEGAAQVAVKTLTDLTCKQYTPAGACAEAGRPLHPSRSLGYLDQLSRVRQATKAAGAMPSTGGMCLGQPSTPAACLDLASTMLKEVEDILTKLPKK